LPLHFYVTTFGQVVHMHTSVTKQYNLLLGKRRPLSVAEKVTTGLAESNGSLLQGL